MVGLGLCCACCTLKSVGLYFGVFALTPSAHPLWGPWERGRSPPLLWQGGTTGIGSLGTGGLPPAADLKPRTAEAAGGARAGGGSSSSSPPAAGRSLPGAGHVHRPEAAAGPGPRVSSILLLHAGSGAATACAAGSPHVSPPLRKRGPRRVTPPWQQRAASPQAEQSRPLAGLREQAHARWAGLGRGRIRQRSAPEAVWAGTLPGHVTRPSRPHSRGSDQSRACAQVNTRLPWAAGSSHCREGLGSPRPLLACPGEAL